MNANVAIEQLLDKGVADLEKRLNADVVTYVGRIVDGADHGFREVIEPRNNKRSKLAIILNTPGGYIEVAEAHRHRDAPALRGGGFFHP